MTNPQAIDPVLPVTTKRMTSTRGRDNAREIAIRSELHRRGLRFRLHQRLLKMTRRSVDIIFPAARVAVFIDGCFWHGCPIHRTWPKNNAKWWSEKIETNIARDRDTDRRLVELGWTIVRVWEHDKIDKAADQIERTVRTRASRCNSRPSIGRA
ncbi:very short patch repair endonuclease [Bradyrhizobium sp. CCBAU 53415]|uniref:very short patch repair endonuclease n=1 Tax=Bradyrhizobium sp. CCBAU 53415 TaxID=1325119 RepID=UPI003FA42D4D